jgi:hypothetical protein
MQQFLSDGTNNYTVRYEDIDGEVFIAADSFGPQFKHMVEHDMIMTKEYNGEIYGSANAYLVRLTEIYRKLDHNPNMQRVLLLNMGACRVLLGKTFDPDIIRATLSNQ